MKILKEPALYAALILGGFGVCGMVEKCEGIFITTEPGGVIYTPPLPPVCEHTPTEFRCVEYVRNYDGDTITFNIPRIHPLLGANIPVRVRGLDTPEIRTSDPCERLKAHAAKLLVNDFLKGAERIDLVNISRGKYFRIVADVIVHGKTDSKSLAKYLLDAGLAYRYDGGTKQKVDWCK